MDCFRFKGSGTFNCTIHSVNSVEVVAALDPVGEIVLEELVF